MATTRRKGIEGSEWALLDTLEVDMYLREKEARAAALAAQQAQQRAALDAQVSEGRNSLRYNAPMHGADFE